MSSRDRLSRTPLRVRVEEEIELLLKNETTLKDLQQARRRNDIESKLSEERPLESVLEKVLKSSPALNSLFLRGQRLAKPFSSGGGSTQNGKAGTADQKKEFVGKRHPTYFKFDNIDYGKTLNRNCEYGRRVRITFKTDVENAYFDRPADKGFFEVESLDSSCSTPSSESIRLDRGYARWDFSLPEDANVGAAITLQTTVSDPTLLEPFVNIVKLNVIPKQERPGGEKGVRKRLGGGSGGDEPSTQGISMPKTILVREGDALWRKYQFSHDTACHVISDEVEDEGDTRLEHVFYVNADNSSIKTEMKYSKQDPRVLEAKFRYGVVLIGLAMLHEDEKRQKANEGQSQAVFSDSAAEIEKSVQDQIREVTSAITPILIPMIDGLSGLEESDLYELTAAGEDS